MQTDRVSAAPSVGPAVQLPDTSWSDWRDPASGRTWRVFAQAPLTAAPAGGHPLLLVLDANQSFVLAAQLARNLLERPSDVRGDVPIVVGIDHPTAIMDHDARRRDFTPPDAAGSPSSGGADALLGFIANQLQPQVAARWPVNATRQTLFGHSLAGLFTMYAMFARPGLFGAYAAASPSLWWRDGQWLRSAASAMNASSVPWRAQVQLSVGALENVAGAQSPRRAAVLAERRPIERTRALAELLRQHAQAQDWRQLQVDFTAYPGLDHGEVMPRALLDALSLARGNRT